MAKREMDIACRKCNTPNPGQNQYCRKCGAVLTISTTIVKAQRRPVEPEDRRFKWRYVGIGVFVMLGLAVVAIAAALLLGLRVGVGEHGIVGGLASFTISVGALFLVSFGVSGALLGALAGRAVSRESFLAAALAVSLLGLVGATVTVDLLITAGVLLLPTGLSAWFGSRLRGARRG